MSKILICQHVAYELLGTLNPLFKQAGFRLRYVNFGRFPEHEPSLEGYDGMVLLGGPMNVDQINLYPHLACELRMIEDALKRDIPILGICLGAQLIAKALGAEVKRNPIREIGWYDLNLTEAGKNDPAFSHFAMREKVFQWHGDTFNIPRGAEHLASSQDCKNQAFRYGDKVYGLQFHLEVDEPMIHRWLEVPQNQPELEEMKEVVSSDVIRQETSQHVHRLKELSEKTFSELMKLFGEARRYRQLPSR